MSKDQFAEPPERREATLHEPNEGRTTRGAVVRTQSANTGIVECLQGIESIASVVVAAVALLVRGNAEKCWLLDLRRSVVRLSA